MAGGDVKISSAVLLLQKNLAVLQKIGAEIEAKHNAPQELWVALRGVVTENTSLVPLGLLHDVIEFCRAVFDSFEPTVTQNERQKRIAQIHVLAVMLNCRIGQVIRGLTGRDNAFLVKWGIVSATSMIAMRQPDPNVRLILSQFGTFDAELQQVDHCETVLAVWLHSLYMNVFAAAYGTVPAGILGIASLGIGLSVWEVKGMV